MAHQQLQNGSDLVLSFKGEPRHPLIQQLAGNALFTEFLQPEQQRVGLLLLERFLCFGLLDRGCNTVI
ncbi:hypothetical protein D3C75_1225970 [compost metagenome]